MSICCAWWRYSYRQFDKTLGWSTKHGGMKVFGRDTGDIKSSWFDFEDELKSVWFIVGMCRDGGGDGDEDGDEDEEKKGDC